MAASFGWKFHRLEFDAALYSMLLQFCIFNELHASWAFVSHVHLPFWLCVTLAFCCLAGSFEICAILALNLCLSPPFT